MRQPHRIRGGASARLVIDQLLLLIACNHCAMQGIWSGFVGLVAFLWGYYGHIPFPDAFDSVHMRNSELAVAVRAVAAALSVSNISFLPPLRSLIGSCKCLIRPCGPGARRAHCGCRRSGRDWRWRGRRRRRRQKQRRWWLQAATASGWRTREGAWLSRRYFWLRTNSQGEQEQYQQG